MTEKNFQQALDLIPKGQHFAYTYGAFEGDYRIITEDKNGNQFRYTVVFDEHKQNVIELKEM